MLDVGLSKVSDIDAVAFACEHDYGNGCGLGLTLEPSGEFNAVKQRHVVIGDDQRWFFAGDNVESSAAVLSDEDLKALLLKFLLKHDENVLFIIDDDKSFDGFRKNVLPTFKAGMLSRNQSRRWTRLVWRLWAWEEGLEERAGEEGWGRAFDASMCGIDPPGG